MASVLSRAKRMFDYGNLDGDVRTGESGPNSLNMDPASESSGMVTAGSRVRRRRRCIWVTSVIAGLAAVVIIAATIQNRHHIQAVAEALVRRDSPLEGGGRVLGGGGGGAKPVTFQDFLRYTFYANTYNGTWHSDSEVRFLDSVGNLALYDVTTNTKSVLISNEKFLRLNPVKYEFSADRKYLLVKILSQKVWRRSSIGSYVLIKIVNGVPQTNNLITLKPKSAKDDLDNNQYLRFVSWSPSGNAIAFVDYSNNLHYRHSAESEDIQLTDTGEDGVIYNGIPDWVSEEEVFEDNKALWWSPDGSRLVYGVFNDTLVESVSLTRYGSWSKARPDKQGYPFLQYPILETIKYPKAGTTNPGVALWAAVVGVRPGERIAQHELAAPASLRGAEAHFSSVAWRDSSTAAVIWMTRLQNVSAITLCSILDNTSCRDVFNLPIRDGWVDYKISVKFNKYAPGDRFLVILPAGNMKYRFRQLFVVDTAGNSRTQLTSAEAEVTEVAEWAADDTVHYLATLPGQPGTRHLHTLRIGRPGATCLTCDTRCGYVEAQFSTAGSYLALDCKGPGIPYSSIVRTADNTALTQWTDNARLQATVAAAQMPRVQYLEVPVAGSSQKAQVELYTPASLAPGDKVPLLVEVYGGPGFQKVDKQWKGYDYAVYAAAGLGVAYAVIDPRGSGFQGDAWRHSVYRRFGSVEVEDTISVTRQLQQNLGFVDAARTAIWGWSYGGYLSLSVLTRDTEAVFACGASVAPVVRWELYDTLYTERYMGRPVDNPEGYNASTPLWRLDNLRTKKYYLVHGTHDDNVHYQQSMMLSGALEEKDILFRQQAYPDQDHSINDYRKHLYHSLTSFFTNDCFGMQL